MTTDRDQCSEGGMQELTRQRLSALQHEGFTVIEAALDSAAITWARAAFERLTPQHWDYTRQSGSLDDHYTCLFNREPGWLPYIDVAAVIDLMEAALGNDCHLIGQTAWRSYPGFIGAELHADHLALELPQPWLADPTFELPMQICTAHFYLNDIDETLCPTCVIPGSHRAGRKPHPGERSWQETEPQPVLCRAGDALIFRSELWHSGSRNRSERTRDLLQVHYGRRMVAQKFAPYLTFRFNDEVLAAATPRQRRLLGEHEAAEYD